MKPRAFLLSSLVCFLLLVVAYVAAVTKLALLERPIPFSYSRYLLKTSGDLSGKVVIDSGSNSLFGIDAKRLSDFFGAPVLIVADVASYPLRKKVLQLKEHMQPGDVLILPLEWDSYSSTGVLSKKFVEKIANEQLQLAHYITDLPKGELLNFVLTEYPLRNAFEALVLARDPNKLKRDTYNRLRLFERTLGNGGNESYGAHERDGPEKMNFIASFSGSCDRYLFERDGNLRLGVSDTFREDLILLSALQEQGVSIYLTWPAVVDSKKSNCYSDAEVVSSLDGYVAEVRKAVAAAGISILGDPQASHFPQECFLNTYYHVRWSCADQRTGLLLADLKGAGAAPIRGGLDEAAFVAFIRKDIQRRLRALQLN